jgi:hypothetical protein
VFKKALNCLHLACTRTSGTYKNQRKANTAYKLWDLIDILTFMPYPSMYICQLFKLLHWCAMLWLIYECDLNTHSGYFVNYINITVWYIDLLWDGRSANRISLRAKFSTPIETPRDPLSLLYSGYRIILGVKRLGRGVNHPPQYSAKVQERVELYICPSFGPSWPVLG